MQIRKVSETKRFQYDTLMGFLMLDTLATAPALPVVPAHSTPIVCTCVCVKKGMSVRERRKMKMYAKGAQWVRVRD